MTLAAVIASISLFVPVTPGVSVSMDRCPFSKVEIACELPAGTYTTGTYNDSVWLDAKPHDVGTFDFRITVAHEYGHAWDQHNLTDADRAKYQAFIGQGGPWLDNTVLGATATPPAGEQFADAFALCATTARARRENNWTDGSYWGAYWEPISKRVLAATCWLVRHHGGS